GPGLRSRTPVLPVDETRRRRPRLATVISPVVRVSAALPRRQRILAIHSWGSAQLLLRLMGFTQSRNLGPESLQSLTLLARTGVRPCCVEGCRGGLRPTGIPGGYGEHHHFLDPCPGVAAPQSAGGVVLLIVNSGLAQNTNPMAARGIRGQQGGLGGV